MSKIQDLVDGLTVMTDLPDEAVNHTVNEILAFIDECIGTGGQAGFSNDLESLIEKVKFDAKNELRAEIRKRIRGDV